MLLKREISEQIMACSTMRAIYNRHEQALGISYRQFTRYVREHFKEDRHEAARQRATLVPQSLPAPLARTPAPPLAQEPKRAPAERRKGFFVDPMAMRSKNLV